MPNAIAGIKREWWEVNAIRQSARALPLQKTADDMRPFAGLRIAPDCHQRATGLPELEPPPAGKREYLLCDLGRRLPHGFRAPLSRSSAFSTTSGVAASISDIDDICALHHRLALF